MPRPAPAKDGSIKDYFFKPFTIPKNRIPANDVIEDEIVLSSPKPSSPKESSRPPVASASPPKHHGPQGPPSSSSFRSSQTMILPTRPSPRKPSPRNVTPQKRSALSQAEDESDLTPLESTPSSSATRRTLKAVEIPSPSPRFPPLALPQFTHDSEPAKETAPQSEDLPQQPPTTSFSSISTLSSAPTTSSHSSRRIMKDGIKAVTNSDSGEDSSDDLADPSTFFIHKKRKITPPPGHNAARPIEIKDAAKSERPTRVSDKDKRSSIGARFPSSPPRTLNKSNLISLVKQRQKEEQAAARMKAAEAAFLEGQKKRNEHMQREQDVASGLREATADDSDEGDRMLLAMQRTEVLQEDEKFFYFRAGPKAVQIEFPMLSEHGSGESKSWMKLLRQEQSRYQAFVTGFVALIASREPLPPEICEWMAAQIPVETDLDLCDAYIEVLDKCASSSLRGLDRFSRLRHFYTTAEDLERGTLRDPKTRPAKLPLGLHNVLKMLKIFCTTDQVSSESVASTTVELIMASADEHIKQNTALLYELHDTIEAVLDAVPGDEQFEVVCKRIHEAFFERTLVSEYQRCRLISSMPATTERTHHLRRLLALHLVADLTSTSAFRGDPESEDWLNTIITQLKTAPNVAISQSSNYGLLGVLIEVLDIAIDAGFSDFSFRSMAPPTKPSRYLTSRPSMSTAEAAFNSQIDNMTKQLQLMSSRIRGSGTTHLRRTEAKSSLERLILRLEHSVRTRPKPRKGIFGGNTGEQRQFMGSFLKPVAAKEDDESDSVRVVPMELLSDRRVDGVDQTTGLSSAPSSGLSGVPDLSSVPGAEAEN